MNKPTALLLLALFVLPFFLAHASTRFITISQPSNQLGVTANWSFDSSTVSGSTVSDLSGNSHDLTLVNGASITTGHSGQALTLDGVDDYAWGLIGSLPTSVSLSMWVKANDVATEQSILTEEGDGAPSSGYHYTLVGIYNGAFYAGFWNIGDIASGPINAGQWYNVVLYYDGVANTQSLYVDGVLQGTQSGTWDPPSNIYFLAGYQQSGCSFTSASGHCGDTAHYFNGQIDDLKGYNRALTSSDISALQTNRTKIGRSNTTSLSSGLVGYWPFDGNTTNVGANTTQDISGVGNTGTLTASGGTVSAIVGKIGQAISLLSGAYILTNASNVSAPCTVSGWVNLQNSSNTSHGYPMMDSGQYSLRLQQVSATIAGETHYGVSDDTFSPSYSVPQNKWTYLTFVNNTGLATLYANGVSQGTIAQTYDCPRAFVGGNSNDWFSGGLDDIRVYNRALSANEIKQLYTQSQATIGNSNTNALSSGLTSYWSMDGSTINWNTGQMSDKSGRGNTGQLISISTTTSPVAGKIGQALKFVSSGQKITGTVSTPSSSYAVSAWIRYQGPTPISAIKVAVAYGPGGANGTLWMGYASDGSIAVSSSAFDIKNSSISSDLKWHHVVGSVSGGTLTAYVDGVSIGTTAMSARGSNALVVADYPGGGFAFPGLVDDVRVYNRPLSASEVMQLYTLGK